MANKLIWGSDLYKGFKLDKQSLTAGKINDILPFQMLTMDQKTEDWIHAVGDYYEMCGWRNVERKAPKIQKNYWMRYGHFNKSDYIINPETNPVSAAIGMIVPPGDQSPLEQFYPLIPNFVDVLRGEFLKRDNTWTVTATDPLSVDAVFKDKEDKFRDIIEKHAQLEKQQTLSRMGLQQQDPQAYQQQLQEFSQHLNRVESETKTFRTTGVQWVEKVLDVHEERYNLGELEPDAFDTSLTVDQEFWHLDLLDDNFKVELLNPKWCDYHKGPGVKYVSDGDYFLWFDFMSCGDIVNKYGRRMKEADLLKLKEVYMQTANMIVPDWQKSYQGAYYDTSKSWKEATDLNPVMNDALLGKELAYNFMRTPNFDHNQDVDILNPVFGRLVSGHPQMFRVMRLYWRSLKRIGWLTKIDRDGTVHPPDWVDENFKVTVKPVYDKSVIKDETKDNLIYGEHVDWTWTTEWRHLCKISPNQKHTFWLSTTTTFESVYLDGGPVKFQFRGKDNPFDGLPPVEGCVFSYLNTEAHGFVDRAKPLQILYNICMNKVPRKILKDYGNKVAIDRRTIPTNDLSMSQDNLSPLEAFEDSLQDSDVLTYALSRDTMEGMGNPALPQVLQLSTIQETQLYFQLATNLKWEAGELIGISRQRVGGAKATETAYSVQQGINFSETQTEKYFEQHSNLMERVRQRMVDATQYYSTFNESNRDLYLNNYNENVFLDIAGMENTTTQYNIFLKSKANTRAALQTIAGFLKEENTLPIRPSSKIQALVEQSVPKILELIREGELEETLKEEAQQKHEIEMEQERRKTVLAQQEAINAQQTKLQQMKNDGAKDVAELRELGGMQSDVDLNQVPDAQDNLKYYLQQQQMNKQSQDAQNAAMLKRQTDLDQLTVDREKHQVDLQKEKIKADAAIKVAVTNRNKYSK